MIGANLAAQVLVAVLGWLNNGRSLAAGGQEPPTELSERLLQERDRWIEESNHQMEATRLRVQETLRRVVEEGLKSSRKTLTATRATLKELESLHGPPTKSDFTIIKVIKSHEASLIERIKLDEAALRELGPLSKPKP